MANKLPLNNFSSRCLLLYVGSFRPLIVKYVLFKVQCKPKILMRKKKRRKSNTTFVLWRRTTSWLESSSRIYIVLKQENSFLFLAWVVHYSEVMPNSYISLRYSFDLRARNLDLNKTQNCRYIRYKTKEMKANQNNNELKRRREHCTAGIKE